jgi:long-chain acyl-CoA synthetase
MFYRCFLESVERWPTATAVEIQRQPGSVVPSSELSTVITVADGHVVESFTYQQLRRYTDGVAQWLIANGVGAGVASGERCAILAMNSPSWVATYLGIIGSGNTAVPLDTAFNVLQVGKLLDDCGATLLFVDERCFAVAQEAALPRNIRLVMLDEPRPGLACTRQMAMDSQPGFAPVEVSSDDVVAIIYTSGTTSDPKGVMLTDGNMVAELACARIVPIGPTDGILGVLPLFHVLAQLVNIFFPLGNGARVTFLDSLNSQELMNALRERHITAFCCVPQFFYLIHERIFGEVSKKGRLAERIFKLLLKISLFSQKFGVNLGKVFFKKVHAQLGPNIHYFVTGGSRFDAQVGRDIQALGFPMLQAFGMTETTSGCFCTSMEDNVIGSIGRPLAGLEAKVVDPKVDENGHLVGEIAIKGPTVMKGYYNRPETTAAAFKDGWFHTGDLGYKDAKGHYFITGRAKDVIVLSSGKNIYPEEVESYYLRSMWIKELCVLGLASRKHGEPLGERLHGVIVPNFEVLRDHKIANVREVIRYDVESISATLPATKRILSYDIWQDDLARTTTRKLRRSEIEKKMLALHAAGKQEEITPKAHVFSDDDRQWLADPEVQSGLAVIADAVGKDYQKELHPDDNLELDLGLDSMERVELLSDLAHHLGAAVADSAASEVYTVRELIDLVRSNAGKAGRQAPGWHTVFEVETTDPAVLSITNERPVVGFFWWLCGKGVKCASHVFFRLRVEGMEHLPEGPFVMCPNHSSYLDAPILTAALPWRVFHNVFYVGTTEIFGSGVMRKFAQFLHLIPVDPDSNLVPAMRAGAYGLRAGKILVMYPEGERSIEGPPKKFKKGAAILAQHLNVPIVPVAEYGFHLAWPRGRGFQGFHRLRIRVGKPIYPDRNEKPEHAYERLTEELRVQVTSMWNELHEATHPDEKKPELTHA